MPKNDMQATLVSNKAKITKDYFYSIVGGDNLEGSQSLTLGYVDSEATATQIAQVRDAINGLMQNNQGSSVATAFALQKYLFEGVNK